MMYATYMVELTHEPRAVKLSDGLLEFFACALSPNGSAEHVEQIGMPGSFGNVPQPGMYLVSR